MAIAEQHGPPEHSAVTPLEDVDYTPLHPEVEVDPFGFRPSDDRRERPETD